MGRFEDWLAKPDEERRTVVKLQSHDGEKLHYHNLADSRYVDPDTSLDAFYQYDKTLIGEPFFKRSINLDGGRSPVSVGNVEIDNSSGRYDHWMTHFWKGYPVEILLGSPDWPISDFGVIITGRVESILPSDASGIEIKLSDKMSLFEGDLLANLFTSGEADGEPVPICIGHPKNMSPVLIADSDEETEFTIKKTDGHYSASSNTYNVNINDARYLMPGDRITIDLTAYAASVESTYLTEKANLAAELSSSSISQQEHDNALNVLDIKYEFRKIINSERGYEINAVVFPGGFELKENPLKTVVSNVSFSYEFEFTERIIIRTYQINDGVVEDSCEILRSDGKTVNLPITKDNSKGQFSVTEVNDASAEFVLDGDLSCAVKGLKVDGKWLRLPGDIILYLVRKVLSDYEIDVEGILSLNEKTPYELSFYYDSQVNFIDALDSLYAKYYWYGFTRTGDFEFKIIDPPGTDSVLDIDLRDDDLFITRRQPPRHKTNLYYRKNFHKLNDDIKGVPWQSKKWLIKDYFYKVVASNSFLTALPHQKENIVSLYSFIDESASASIEGIRIQALESIQQFIYTIEKNHPPFQLTINDIVNLKKDRYGLNDGRNTRAFSVTDYYTNNRVELDLWN